MYLMRLKAFSVSQLMNKEALNKKKKQEKNCYFGTCKLTNRRPNFVASGPKFELKIFFWTKN